MAAPRVVFGEFVLDRGARQLLRAGAARHLGPKAFELLDLLVSQRPNVVTKERIRARLWPDTYVSDSTLVTVVAEVRSALDEDPREPRLLRTAHGVGYAFCADATESGAGRARLGTVLFRLHLEDREVALRSGENLLGRVEEGVAWIEAPTVSRRHARIIVENGRAVLEDLGSKNGTFVGGRRISKPTSVTDGDVIRLGRVEMKLCTVRPDESTLSDSG